MLSASKHNKSKLIKVKDLDIIVTEEKVNCLVSVETQNVETAAASKNSRSNSNNNDDNNDDYNNNNNNNNNNDDDDLILPLSIESFILASIAKHASRYFNYIMKYQIFSIIIIIIIIIIINININIIFIIILTMIIIVITP